MPMHKCVHACACTHISSYYHPCFCHFYFSFVSVYVFLPHFNWTLFYQTACVLFHVGVQMYAQSKAK